MAFSDEDKVRAMARIRAAREQRNAASQPSLVMVSGPDGNSCEVEADDAQSFSAALERPGARDFARRSRLIIVDTDAPLTTEELLMEEAGLMGRWRAGDLKVVFRASEEKHEMDLKEVMRRHALSPVQRTALEGARSAQPLLLDEQPGAAGLTEPPVDCQGLPRGRPTTQKTRPDGELAPFTGPRISEEELKIANEYWPESAARVLAYPVPALTGRVLVTPDIESLPDAIRGFLKERLGDVVFRVEASGYGAPGKYFHMHASVVGPPDGEIPMALELYGRIIALGDMPLGSREFAEFLIARRKATATTEKAAQTLEAALPGPIFIFVETATYANVQFTRVGIPEYE